MKNHIFRKRQKQIRDPISELRFLSVHPITLQIQIQCNQFRNPLNHVEGEEECMYKYRHYIS